MGSEPMINLVTQLGVGGIFAVLLLRTVFDYLRRREARDEGSSHRDMFALLRCIKTHVEDLHEWHAVTDDDGVKVWYVRRSLETAVEKLADNIAKMTEILNAMHREILDLKKQKEG